MMRCLFLILTLWRCIEIASSQNLTETLLLNLDVTVTKSSGLSLTTSTIQSAISTAFIDTNTETQIYDTDELQTIADFYYLSDDEQFEYHAILHVPFLSTADYERAVTFGYAGMSESDTESFVQTLEANLYNSLDTLLSTDASSLQLVMVNTLKMIQTGDVNGTGTGTGDGNTLLIAYASIPTTTTTEVTTPLPTSSMTETEGTSLLGDDKTPITSIVYVERESASSASYTFDEESSYWILLVFFLFLGCCFGCCCWYMWLRMDGEMRLRSCLSNSGEEANDVEMNKGHKAAKISNTYEADEEEQEGNTKQRDYGSEDSESETETETEVDVVVKRKHSNDVQVKYTENSSSEDEAKKIERILNKGHGKKQEKDRYDTDGKRILTTKELMAKYKKKRAKPSVDWTYKVGGKTPKGDDAGGNGKKYQFEDQETGIDEDPRNHPHYQPEPIPPSQRKPKPKTQGKAAKKTTTKVAKTKSVAAKQKARPTVSPKKNKSNKLVSKENLKVSVGGGSHGKNVRRQSAGPTRGSSKKQSKQMKHKSKSHDDSDDSEDEDDSSSSEEEEEEEEEQEKEEEEEETDEDDNASSSSQQPPPKKGYQQGTPKGTPRQDYSESETESY